MFYNKEDITSSYIEKHKNIQLCHNNDKTYKLNIDCKTTIVTNVDKHNGQYFCKDDIYDFCNTKKMKRYLLYLYLLAKIHLTINQNIISHIL